MKKKYTDFLAEISTVLPEKLVFLDEAGVHLAMTRTYARAPQGERAIAKRLAGRASNISLVGAVRLSGMSALYPYDGPVDGRRFLSFLDAHLLKTLKPGDVLVMDNLRVHHIAEVKAKMKLAQIRLLYLPPYAPELNPIEEIWSLIKRTFRDLEARTISAFVDAMHDARALITTPKIEAVFRHADYALGE